MVEAILYLNLTKPETNMKYIEQKISRMETFLVFIMIIFLVSGITFRMIARNFLSSELALELSDKISSLVPHGILLLGLLGASAGITRSEVISIDLLNHLFNDSQKKKVLAIGYFFTGVLCLLFLVLAYKSRLYGDVVWIWLGYMPVLSLLILKSVFKLMS